MRGLTPLDYRLLTDNPPWALDEPLNVEELNATRRLFREGRIDRETELTSAGCEALRIYEALLAAGVTL